MTSLHQDSSLSECPIPIPIPTHINTAVQLTPAKTCLKLHDKVLLALRSLVDVSQSAETEFGAENTHKKENY
jgi:hypothetical protein